MKMAKIFSLLLLLCIFCVGCAESTHNDNCEIIAGEWRSLGGLHKGEDVNIDITLEISASGTYSLTTEDDDVYEGKYAFYEIDENFKMNVNGKDVNVPAYVFDVYPDTNVENGFIIFRFNDDEYGGTIFLYHIVKETETQGTVDSMLQFVRADES